MKNIFAVIALFTLMGLAGQAQAYTETVEVAKSTATATVVAVSSSAATQIDAAGLVDFAGYNRNFIRIGNTDATNYVSCGFTSGVTLANGEIIKAGEKVELKLGRGIKVWCLAASASVNVSVVQTGYR